MGVWGWDEIQDGVKLQGIARGSAFVASDDDWNLNVAPALGFKHLLTNQHGQANRSGLIECEVEPPQHLSDDLGQDVENDAVANQMLGSPDGQWVTVVGTWSVDKSHTVFGDDADVGGDSALGKTEIHPITSILIEHPPAADNSSRQVDFLVFSDDSANVPAHVPHSHEDRQGTYQVPIPPGGAFKLLLEIDKTASKSITTADTARIRTVKFQVSSGKAEDGKGFYHARVSLPGFTLLTFLLSRGSDPTKGIREMMRRAQTTSLRKLFQQLDAAVLPDPKCAGLLSQIAQLQSQIADVSQQEKVLQKDGTKPKQDPAFQELQKQMKDLLAKLTKLSDQADALGCFG